MDIGPVDNSMASPESGDAKQKRAAPEEDLPADRKDDIALSEQARELQKVSQSEDGAKQEKLREIKERIDRGYYSRPKVTDKIAERILGEESVEVDFLRAKYPVFFEGIPDSEPDETAAKDEIDGEE